MVKSNLGFRLKALRGERRITDIAKQVGVSKSALSMYEAGKRTPRDAVKIKLAEFYGVSVGALFFAEESHET